MHPDFIILLCLMPDNFSCKGESAAIQWVHEIFNAYPTSFRTLLIFTLSKTKPKTSSRNSSEFISNHEFSFFDEAIKFNVEYTV